MSLKEVDRLRILERVGRKELTQKEGAKLIGIGKRQMIRVCQEFKEHGPLSVISAKRGMPSNRRLPDAVRDGVTSIIRAQYHDFGPTLAHEKLTDEHSMIIGVESVRQLMIEGGLWKAKSRKRIDPHQMRVRRSQRGELIQIDGSPHAWFEKRGPLCCLLVAIDDATGEVMSARFVSAECTEGYFDLMEDYFKRHGRPLALYSDKHGIFRVNAVEAASGTGETQFGRGMRELAIEIICANTPQAKGRVERMNQTLQDRLVKEMRLCGISDMEAGNAFLPGFLRKLNKKFAVVAASPIDAHRSEQPSTANLHMILSTQTVRKLSKSLELQYHNVTYQIQVKTPSYALRGASVRVCERKGIVTLLYKGKILAYTTFDKRNQVQEIVSSKEINERFDRRSLGNKPKNSHPWKANYPAKPEAAKMNTYPQPFQDSLTRDCHLS